MEIQGRSTFLTSSLSFFKLSSVGKAKSWPKNYHLRTKRLVPDPVLRGKPLSEGAKLGGICSDELPMARASAVEITELLRAWGKGDEAALDKLTPLVYAELHRLARHYMGRERPEHLLQTTALVNEAYLRLIGWRKIDWQNRAHFFGLSARLMRNILVDFARKSRRGPVAQVSLDEACLVSPSQGTDLVALDEALKALADIDPRKSKVVELRFFGGLSVDETAEVLSVSAITVMRDWKKAKA